MSLIFSFLFLFNQNSDDTLRVKNFENKLFESFQNEDNAEMIIEELIYLHDNPIVLSTANEDELLSIPLITNREIDIVLNWRDTTNDFSWKSLKNVFKNKPQFILLLQYCMVMNEDEIGYLKIRNRIVLPQSILPLLNRNQEELKLYNRVNFKTHNLKSNLLIEKDSFEDYKNGFTTGFIEYNFSQSLPQIIIGDYSISVGEGLAISKNIFSSISNSELKIPKSNKIISASSSSDEYKFMRGIASKINLNQNISIYPFYSNRNKFGNLNEEGIISSVSYTGFALGKEIFNENIFGVVSKFSKRNSYEINFTSLNAKYDKIINSNEPMNLDSNKFSVIGISGTNYFKNSEVFYDYAKTDKNKNALAVGFLSEQKYFSYLIHFRNYRNGFSNPFAGAIRQNNFVGSENGIILGIETRITDWLKIVGFIDDFSILKNDDFSSSGREYSLRIENQFSKSIESYFLFKQKDYLNSNKKTYRFNFIFNFKNDFEISQRIEFVDLLQLAYRENGILLFTDFKYKLFDEKISIASRIISFSSDSYNSRLYQFENEIPGNISFLPLYGNGLRFYFYTNWKINEDAILSFKISTTRKKLENIYENKYETQNQFSLQLDLVF